MNKAFDIFEEGIERTKKSFVLYEHFIGELRVPHSEVSDILRFQLVNAVSEFDRFIHDLVIKGVIEEFSNKRKYTPKFRTFPFRAESLIKMIKYLDVSFKPSSPQETAEYVVLCEMRWRLSYKSFQDAEKVMDGLSIIWNEQHKYQVLADYMALPGSTSNDKVNYLKQQHTLIVQRRDQIVHEGDFDYLSNQKRDIDKSTVTEAIDFIELLAKSIYKFVTDKSCYI